MKTRNLATVAILLGSFLLTPGLAKAQDHDWYQGRQGRWIQEQNAWRFRDRDGDEYRQQGDQWVWVAPRAMAPDSDQWFQGHRGHWVHFPNGWRFRAENGQVYRRQGDSWQWVQGQRGPDRDGDYR